MTHDSLVGKRVRVNGKVIGVEESLFAASPEYDWLRLVLESGPVITLPRYAVEPIEEERHE